MARIRTYALDNNVTGSDYWIGTDGNDNSNTKNFSPNSVAQYLNENEIIDVSNSVRFRYDTIDSGQQRKDGTISFQNEIGATVPMSDLSSFVLSKKTQSGKDVSFFLNVLPTTKVILHKSNDINIFGLYRVLSVTTDLIEPNFFNVSLEFISGHGSIEEDKDYIISLIDLNKTIPVLQLTKETFNYVSSSSFTLSNTIGNILQVIINTTSLHPEGYSYTLPSTVTILNELHAGDVITVVYNYLEEFLEVPNLQRVTNIGNHTTNNIIIDNIPGEYGSYTVTNTLNDLGTFQSYTSPINIDYQSVYAAYEMSINEIYSPTVNFEMFIGQGIMQTSYTNGDDYNAARISSGNSVNGPSLYIEKNDITGQLKIDDLTENITLQFPDKPTGTYTIATLDDIPTLPSFLEYNETDKTVWNNGKGNINSNTTFGGSSLINLSTSTNNTAFGFNSLSTLSNGGNNNTAIGVSSLSTNNNEASTAVGSQAMFYNTGGYNTAVGFNALYTGSGSSNVAIGVSSLQDITTGSNNVAIGASAGRDILVMNSSVFIGQASIPLASGQTNQIVIGQGAVGAGSNTATLGNDSITSTILKGLVKAPLTTNALIDADTTGKAVVTKEYVNNKISTYNTYFVNSVTGNNTTGVFQDASKPFATIDYILNLPSVPEFSIILIQNAATFYINSLIPVSNITFKSDYNVTISYANNTLTTISSLNLNGTYFFNIPKGTIDFTSSINKSISQSNTILNITANNLIVNSSFVLTDINSVNFILNTLTHNGGSFIKTSSNTNQNNLKVTTINCSTSACTLFESTWSTTNIDFNLISGNQPYRLSYVNYSDIYVSHGDINITYSSSFIFIDGYGKTSVLFKNKASVTGQPIYNGASYLYMNGYCDFKTTYPYSGIISGNGALGGVGVIILDRCTFSLKSPLFSSSGVLTTTSIFKIIDCYITTNTYLFYTYNPFAQITLTLPLIEFNGSNVIYLTGTLIDYIYTAGATPPGYLNRFINVIGELKTNGIIQSGITIVTKIPDLVTETASPYTLTNADSGGIVIFTASTTLTIPTGLADGFECTFVTLAGAALTVVSTGNTLNNASGSTMAAGLSFTLKRMLAANTYIATGDL